MDQPGQNAFEQARQFTAATEVTSLAVTKLDGTAKGGVVNFRSV
jgi:fused signal recognition particle receptor